MTTIVYRAGVLAGEGRETIQNDEHSSYYILRDDCIKVWRLKDGSLFGAAHGSEDIERLRLALVNKVTPPKLEDVCGLRVDPKGRMWVYEGNIWQRQYGKYYAVGSGSILAFAALDAGADAIMACKIAAKRDPYSGGKVTAVRLSKRK
jgi:hypothetical protein